MLADHIGIPQLRDLASRSVQFTDKIGLSEMTRLAELAHPSELAENSSLDVQISVHSGSQGFPEISGSVSGSLGLSCQRCLGVLHWPLEVDFRLAVIEKEEDIDNVAEPFDTVVAGSDGVRFAEIVEDELIGSLPLAPMHDDSADCGGAPTLSENKLVSVNDAGSSEASVEGDMNRPFAELSAMLKSTDGADRED